MLLMRALCDPSGCVLLKRWLARFIHRIQMRVYADNRAIDIRMTWPACLELCDNNLAEARATFADIVRPLPDWSCLTDEQFEEILAELPT